MALIPCNNCRRHVRDREASCPFCSAALHPGGRTARSAGAASGIAVIAIASLALTGCQKDQPAPIEPDGTENTAVDGSDVESNEPVDEPTAAADEPPTEQPAPEEPDDPAPTDSAAQNQPGTAQPPPSATTITKPPNFDRPMVARYGVAPRPTPPDWK